MWGINKSNKPNTTDEPETKPEIEVKQANLIVREKKIQAHHFGHTSIIYMIIFKDVLTNVGYQNIVWNDPSVYVKLEKGKTYKISYVQSNDEECRIWVKKIEECD